MESKYTIGQVVRILPEFCDQPAEAGMRFVIVEDNENRCIIELVCDLPIKPQELVLKHMISKA
jgi:hypothetical protein